MKPSLRPEINGTREHASEKRKRVQSWSAVQFKAFISGR